MKNPFKTIFSGKKEAKEDFNLGQVLSANAWNFRWNIFGNKLLTPHEEMRKAYEVYYYNSLVNASVSTLALFMAKDKIIVKSDDELIQQKVQNFVDTHIKDIHQNVLNFLITGNSYFLIQGQTLINIPDSSRVYLDVDPSGKVRNYIYEIPGYEQTWTISYYGTQFGKITVRGKKLGNVLHIKNGINKVPFYGRSFLASIINDSEILLEMEKSMALISKYRAVPKKIFAFKNLPHDKVATFANMLDNLSDEENLVVSVPDDINVIDYSFAGRDINLSYMLDHIKRKIVSGLAPEFLVGLGNEVNRATAKEELTAFNIRVKALRKAYLTPIEEWIKKTLNIFNFELDFGDYEFKDEAQEKAYLLNLYNSGVITKNELRTELGFPEDPEGDEYKTQTSGNQMLGLQTYETKQTKSKASGIDTEIKEYQKIIKQIFDPDEFKIQVFGLYAEDLDLSRIRQNIENFYENYTNKLQNYADKISNIINKVYEKAIKRILGKSGMQLRVFVPVIDQKAIEQLTQNQLEYLKSLTQDQKKRTLELLQEAEVKGWSIPKLRDEMTRKVKALTKARAEVIARTELVKAHNIGMVNTMKEAGIKKYQWITARDSNVCEVCRKLDGKVFEVGKGKLPVIDTHPNCRCSVVAVE